MNRRVLLSACTLLFSACSDDQPRKKLKIAGGGLQFNYRYSQASIVLVAQTSGTLPEDATVEVLIERDAGVEPERISEKVLAGKLLYRFQSSPLQGIKKGDVFKVTLRLVDEKGIELERHETQFKSDEDQSNLPSKPLVDPSKPNYVPQLENLQ